MDMHAQTRPTSPRSGAGWGETSSFQLDTPDPNRLERLAVLRELVSVLDDSSNWETRLKLDDPVPGMTLNFGESYGGRLLRVPELDHSSIDAFNEQFEFSRNLGLSVVMELVALNYLKARNLSEVFTRLGIEDATEQSAYGSAFHSSVPDRPHDDERKLEVVYDFLRWLEVSCREGADESDLAQNSIGECLVVHPLDYGGVSDSNLSEYLERQALNIRSKRQVFVSRGQSRSEDVCVNVVVDPPEFGDPGVHEYLARNSQILSELSLLERDSAEIPILRLEYPFPHELGINLRMNHQGKIEPAFVSLHANKIDLEADSKCVQRILKAVIAKSDEITNDTTGEPLIVEPSAFQVIPCVLAKDRASSFEGFVERIRELYDLQLGPFRSSFESSRIISELRRRWPLTLEHQEKLRKWLSKGFIADADLQRVREFHPDDLWSRYSLHRHEFYLDLVPGTLEQKMGYQIRVGFGDPGRHHEDWARFSTGFSLKQEDGGLTIEISSQQYADSLRRLEFSCVRPISESQRRELSKDGSRALVRAVRNVTGHHPNDVMLGLLKHWAARSGEVRLKILYGRDNLWFRYHQDRVDPDQRVAASASRHAFQEDREKTGYYWSSTNPAADSQVRLAPGTIESLLPTFSQLMDSVL